MRPGFAAYLFILPALALYLLFVALPVIQVAAYSLFSWDSGVIKGFAGLANYARLFGDEVFWIALGHNAIWVILTLTFPLGIGLFPRGSGYPCAGFGGRNPRGAVARCDAYGNGCNGC